MEYCSLNYKDFKRTVTKKFTELQENVKRQFKELRNKIFKEKEFFTQRLKLFLKKNQILKLKNSVNERKNTLESNENRAEHLKEINGKHKDRNLETMQVEKEKELRSLKKIKSFYDNYLTLLRRAVLE